MTSVRSDIRSTSRRQIALVVLALILAVLFVYPGSGLLLGWSSTEAGGIHRFHTVVWGMHTGLVLSVGLFALVVRTEEGLGQGTKQDHAPNRTPGRRPKADPRMPLTCGTLRTDTRDSNHALNSPRESWKRSQTLLESRHWVSPALRRCSDQGRCDWRLSMWLAQEDRLATWRTAPQWRRNVPVARWPSRRRISAYSRCRCQACMTRWLEKVSSSAM